MEKTKQVSELVEVKSRTAVVGELTRQLRRSSSISFVSADAGVGKTSLVSQVQRDVGQPFRIVSFTEPVYSYEEFVKNLAVAIQCEISHEQGKNDIQQLSAQCIEKIQRGAEKHLVICDEAHSIYLATFERILRFHNELIECGASIHLIFVGGPLLGEIYERLVSNRSVEPDALNVSLPLLTKEECGSFFLDLVKRDRPNINHQAVSSACLDQLYSATKGNMKEIKKLADKAVENPKEDASFFSLLNDIEDTGQKQKKRRVARSAKKTKTNRNRNLYLALTVVVSVMVGAVYFYFSKGEQLLAENVEPVKVAEKTVVAVSKPKTSVAGAAGTEALKAAKNVEVVLEEAVEKGTSEVESVKKAVKKTNPTSPFKPFVPAVDILLVPGASTAGAVEVAKEESTQVKSEMVKEIETLQATKKVVKEVVLEPKRQVGSTQQLNSSKMSAEELYKNRAAATVAWLDKRDSGYYTMQVMALTSDKSKLHLLEFLDKNEYRDEAGNFYILRKKQSPQALYVFYGEYSSKDSASQARESLPEFLKNQKPYLVSVDGALKKAGL